MELVQNMFVFSGTMVLWNCSCKRYD